jgi:hypothetical protein
MSKRFTLAFALSTILTATSPSFCAEVTPDDWSTPTASRRIGS